MSLEFLQQKGTVNIYLADGQIFKQVYVNATGEGFLIIAQWEEQDRIVININHIKYIEFGNNTSLSEKLDEYIKENCYIPDNVLEKESVQLEGKTFIMNFKNHLDECLNRNYINRFVIENMDKMFSRIEGNDGAQFWEGISFKE